MTLRLAWERALAQGKSCALLFVFVASACSANRVALPSGPGAPYPGYAAAADQATEHCRGVKTMTATLALSGRAGEQKLRGRVDAGFSAPGAARLEGRAPFGRPVFVLVARDDANAMLVLPRDNRVLRHASAAAIVEALTGVKLTPDELRAAIAGCGFGGASPSAGRAYGSEWVAVDAGEAVHYLRRVDGRWRLVASTRGPLTVDYRDFLPARPATIRMRTASSSGGPDAQTDLTVRLSEVEINVPLGPEVFEEDVPAGADPLTIEELRRAGPLGDSAR